MRAHEINRRLVPRHDITVLTGYYPGAKTETRDGVQYRRLGTSGIYLGSRLSFTMALPFVRMQSAYDLVVNDFSLFAPCFAATRPGRPVVHILHHILGTHALRKYPVIGVLPLLAERVGFSQARAAITVSPSVQQALRQYLHPACRTWYVPNGVASQLFDVEPADRGYLLFLGRLDIYMKGLDVLLTAYAQVRQVHPIPLKIVGHGAKESRQQLQKQVRKLHLTSCVEFLDQVDETQKCELFGGATLVCQPSRFEGWGIVAVEAAAAGKAVVGTDIPGLRDAVVANETGLLVPPDNPEALAAAIRRLLDDPELRQSLGQRGRERARQFDWDVIATEQEQVYQAVLDHSGA